MSVLLSFCPSILPSFCPEVFLGLARYFFSENQHGEAHVLCVSGPIFFKKIFCPKNGENGPKIGFFYLLENLVIIFFWIWKESSYYLLYFCTNPILGKNQVPEIWAKMLSVNQIAGFLNWLYLQNKMMKKTDFLNNDTVHGN